ncbi:hypothetical protein BHM03_00000774 [Ensete ventricosum]|nr:hypothetical protein BHM03_00000774 [Ensete ventricosum]
MIGVPFFHRDVHVTHLPSISTGNPLQRKLKGCRRWRRPPNRSSPALRSGVVLSLVRGVPSLLVRLFAEMAATKWSSQTSGYETAIWATKIAFCFLGVVSCGAAARAAVPAAAEALSAALPGFCASLRSWLAPPYLFIAVHLIILVIWKLSDQMQHREQWTVEERTAEPGSPRRFKAFGPAPTAGLLRVPSPGILPPPTTMATPAPDPVERSPSEASCLTAESGLRSTASSALASKRSVEPESQCGMTTVEEEVAEAVAGTENESTEAPRKVIGEQSPPPAAAHASHDELNRQFDDFIKKNREQIRLLSSRRRQ